MDRATLLSAVYRALPLGHEVQAAHQPGGWVATVDGFRLARYGPGTNRLAAMGVRAAVDLEPLLAVGRSRFEGEPFRVVLDAAAGRPLALALAARGWRPQERFPTMALAPVSPTVPTPPPELRINLVQDEAALEDWFAAASPGARAPDDPPEVDYNRRYIHATMLAGPAIALFSGYVEGRPVASAACYLAGDVADIGAVATWPELRRHGYGAALTWAAIAEAAARGCTAAALHPSALGYPVYARMGFVPVTTLLVLTNAE